MKILKFYFFYILYFWKNKKNNLKEEVKKVNKETIRTRLKTQGWNILEIPIKKRDQKTNTMCVYRWKVVANKNQRSFEVSGATIDEALNKIGKTLGVVSRDN